MTKHGYALEYVPEDKRSPEICLAAVKQDGHALAFVPEDKRSPEICLAAVTQNEYALCYVPDHLKSEIREKCAHHTKCESKKD